MVLSEMKQKIPAHTVLNSNALIFSGLLVKYIPTPPREDITHDHIQETRKLTAAALSLSPLPSYLATSDSSGARRDRQ
jgi:hypothetical protein